MELFLHYTQPLSLQSQIMMATATPYTTWWDVLRGRHHAKCPMIVLSLILTNNPTFSIFIWGDKALRDSGTCQSRHGLVESQSWNVSHVMEYHAENTLRHLYIHNISLWLRGQCLPRAQAWAPKEAGGLRMLELHHQVPWMHAWGKQLQNAGLRNRQCLHLRVVRFPWTIPLLLALLTPLTGATLPRAHHLF